jgi:ubiquinone/menaquinone biosynthesis C-methylase UbiE
MSEVYTHGHHASVLRSHSWRTVENSAAYLVPYLAPGARLLDVGCGPGTITLDFAARLLPGEVIGIDASDEIVEQAEAARATAGVRNASFRTANVYELPFADDSFDVVHAHQVLQHLTDPVAALREMARVARPNGVIAARDSDYTAFAWAPADPRLDRWNEMYHAITRRNNAEADAGRYLLGWAQAAGLRDIVATSSTWTFADPEARAWWGGLWADRVEQSSFATQAIEYGLSDRAELTEIAAAWRAWARQPDGMFIVPSGEIIARP